MARILAEGFAKRANLRAVLLGTMGIIALLFSDFLQSGMIRAIAVYMILNGCLAVRDWFAGGTDKKVACGLMTAATIICGILCIAYHHYLTTMQPVFYGAVLMVEGSICFVTATGTKGLNRALLTVLSLIVAVGGLALIVFTFGFGGLPTLSRMLGALLLVSCVCEAMVYCSRRRMGKRA